MLRTGRMHMRTNYFALFFNNLSLESYPSICICLDIFSSTKDVLHLNTLSKPVLNVMTPKLWIWSYIQCLLRSNKFNRIYLPTALCTVPDEPICQAHRICTLSTIHCSRMSV
mmetsp:Transcript_22432/g.36692  ORF Transcript_22432/g.36692 Transcript_22432/m.36692 type:complete len:112 (-) Transcript_22432:66-401(-)